MARAVAIMALMALACAACSAGGRPSSDQLRGCDMEPEHPSLRLALSAEAPPTVTVRLRAGIMAEATRGAPINVVGRQDILVRATTDVAGFYGADHLGTVRLVSGDARATIHVVCH